MVDDDHTHPPKTVQEIGIHIGYMREDLKEIKDSIDKNPDRKEFDALKKTVGGNTDSIIDINEREKHYVTTSQLWKSITVLGVVLGVIVTIIDLVGRIKSS